MSKTHFLRATLSASLVGAAFLVQCGIAAAQAPAAPAKAAGTSAAKPKPAAKAHPAKKPAAKAAPVEAPLAPASPEQIDAAERIFYGKFDCEFKQTLDIAINPKYPAYADVTFNKKMYTMKPVLSSTGAMRLEDVKAQAILIQIAQKSMLLNTVNGQRLVDECVHPKQRELMEQAKKAAEAEAVAATAPPAAK